MHLTLNLTTSCNMNCTYCYAPPRPGPAMSEQTAFAALELGARLNHESCGIAFFGGEPLLHKDLIAAVVERGRAMEKEGKGHFHFKLTTNGLLLDDAFLQLAQREHIMLAMSVDGVEQAHDAHRRLADGSPSFEPVRASLARLLAAKPYASVICVVNPDTARHLSESIAWLLDAGCRYLIVVLNHAADWTERDFGMLEKQYRKLATLYRQWTRAGRKFYFSPFETKISSHVNRHCYHKDRCELGNRQLSVDTEGYLYPCVQFPRAGHQSRWCIGNVIDGVDEKARQAIRAESETEKAFCRDCVIKDRCNNTCGCLNWQTTGDINAISPVLCRNEQLLTTIVDRLAEKLYREREPHFLQKHYSDAYPVLSLLEDLGYPGNR